VRGGGSPVTRDEGQRPRGCSRGDAGDVGIAAIETQGTSTMTAWSVYIVRCADGTLYTGISTDVAARIAAHNRGSGAKYTRSRMPVELVYQEPAFDRGAAQKRE